MRLPHQDGVDAGALQLVDLHLRDVEEVGDRELARPAGRRGDRARAGAARPHRARRERPAPGRAVRVQSRARPRPRRGRRARCRRRARTSSVGPTTLASAAESPEVRIGSALAARIASRLPSASRASAPSASARCAASGPSTATISEMPSPSDMAWLRRLGPVTRRNGTSVGRIGYRGIVLLRLAIVLLVAALPAVAGGAVRATVLGTQRADFLAGTESSDRIVARGGNDRIAVEYDGGVDRISCGAGQDAVVADARDRVESDCEIVSRRIHRDRHTNPESQHESEVEPDSQTVGQTTVAVFQVGRNRAGGAASIGFSTSKDGGRTWREGTLPGLTANTTPRGPSARASDPVVAYDAAHGVWLANTLAIAPDATRLTIHRSMDGLSWSGPIDAALSRAADLAYDKNWLTCDNGAASPFRGRCYLAYTLVGGARGRRRAAALRRRRPHLVAGGDPAHRRHRRDSGRAAGRQARAHVLVRPHRNGRDHIDRRRRRPRAPGDDLRPARQGVPSATRATADRGRRRRRGARRGRLAGLPLQRRLRRERRRALALGRRHDLVAAGASDVGPRRGHADTRVSSPAPAGSRSSTT